MINLLPPLEKEKLSMEMNNKMAMVLGYIARTSLISLILVLFSVKFYILGNIRYHQGILSEAERQYKTEDFLFFKDIVQASNASLVKIDTFYKKDNRVADAAVLITGIQKPHGLYLTEVSLSKADNSNVIKASVAGVSDSRDSLLAFKSNIENNEKITSIYFPPNNWVKPSEFDFYLT